MKENLNKIEYSAETLGTAASHMHMPSPTTLGIAAPHTPTQKRWALPPLICQVLPLWALWPLICQVLLIWALWSLICQVPQHWALPPLIPSPTT